MIKNSIHHDQLRIFLAEDDPEDRTFFKDAFDAIRMRHTLTMFEDGSALMEYLNTEDIELPDIIFMDVAMPGLSGMECLRAIRSAGKLSHIVVAIYSVTSSPAKVEKAFVEGANIYIKKPAEFAELRKIIIDVTNRSWQYMTDGLNRKNFVVNY